MFTQTKTKLKAAFEQFLTTFNTLAAAIKEQTKTNRTIEASANLRHVELVAAIEKVSQSTSFLETVERKKLERSGHKV
jgi:hypothetical protein